MKRLSVLLIFLIHLPGFLAAQSDFERVKRRVVSELMKDPVNDDRVARLAGTIQMDGSWPGIDYADVSNTGFEHARHLGNMVLMSRAYQSEGSSFYHNEELNRLINTALGFWCDHDFICENWWYNQIGTPQALVTVLLVMEDHIESALKTQTLAIIGRANLEASGARPGGDRIKIGGIAAKGVLATGDEAQFARIMQVINDEIRFNTGDRGMQQDYSFHHRVDRVNNTVSYGLGYAETFVEWASYVEGTVFAFSQDRIRQLVDYYLDGICKQYIYGIYTDPGVRNRDISRGDSFRAHGTEIPEKLLEVTDYRAGEIMALIRLRKGEPEQVDPFSKFFWQSEHFVCQRPGYYTSVRMFSVRNRNMEEPYNSEGLKNHHKADGANFLSIRGDEYLNIWPVYDWQKIPGSTVLQKPSLPSPSEIQQEGLTTFVGGVTDGTFGAAGFDFISPHDLTKARKSWFFFDDEYVCLGAGIESNQGFPVATTLNQCLLHGPVVVRDMGGKRSLPAGDHKLDQVSWVYHDGVGYQFPQPAELCLSNQLETGSWWEISKQWNTSRESVEKEVFKLWIDHGVRPQGRSGGLVNAPMIAKDVTYAYIIVPGVEVAELDLDPGIEILSNSRWIQAVKQREPEMVQAIFYRAGTLKIAEGLELTVDSPGALMFQISDGEIQSVTVADPTRTLDRLHIILSGHIRGKGNESLKIEYDRKPRTTGLTISLPEGLYAGSSVTVNL
jgi:chondroitin AC lyase